MKDFLNSLYNYEYFGLYLIISIIVLVILFLIILFFGKKDQKVREIEATKKLQQINSEAFKEDSAVENLEINNVVQNNLQPDNVVTPKVEDLPSINNVEENNEIPEPVLPIQGISDSVSNDTVSLKTVDENISLGNVEPIVESRENVDETLTLEKVGDPLFVNEEKPIEITPEVKIEERPILEKVEEKPFMLEETNIFDAIDPMSEEAPVKPMIKSEIEELEVPEFNYDEIVKDVEDSKVNTVETKGPQIFSSVYIPEKKEEVTLDKVEVKVENSNDEFDIELPTLKKEVQINTPELKEEKFELNDYNLDDLSGETYTINK